MNIPGLMLAATGSGSGKTLLSCGLMRAFQRRKRNITSFKCGPDYIDPMFHTKVLGTKSRNLDTFLSDRETVRYLYRKHSREADLAVIEGVMGYYDGVGGISTRASAYELAKILNIPVILVINAKGMSFSAAALVKGFLDFRQDSHIRGVILNQLSPMLYDRMKEAIEREAGVKVYGYLPVMEECEVGSRHLGLLLPEEIQNFKSRINKISDTMEETLDLEGLLELAKEQGMPGQDFLTEDHGDEEEKSGALAESIGRCRHRFAGEQLRIAYARDEAFCFCYEDNLELLYDMGAMLVPFSPVRDAHLPKDTHGLLLFGGYPELYARKLSNNITMRKEIKDAVSYGVPTLAECGGFLYLGESLQEKDSEKAFPMAGVFPTGGYDTGKLVRFGYVELTEGKVFGRDVGTVRAHEFHHYDTHCPGEDFFARKPSGDREWRCIHSSDTVFAGFPHQYFYGNLGLPEAFLAACLDYKKRNKK
ncbi:MAG: cobyrinate a,c-diamide synthase [Roseburia sp.]|nr:cobyrinate a,c-diamide synthase [Roseburia sp.]